MLKVLSLFLVSFIGFECWAQNTGQVTTFRKRNTPGLLQRVIAIGGPTIAEMQGYSVLKSESRIEPRNSAYGGALIDIGYTNFVLETGLLYRGMGAIETAAPNQMGYYGGEYALNYLSVPMIAKYYFVRSRIAHTAYLKFGIMPSRLVRTEYAISTSDGDQMGSQRSQGVEEFELGGFGGFGGRFNLGSGFELHAEASYYRGINRVFEDLEVYNSGWLLGAGLGYRL